MITKIGQSVLDELTSELTEKIADKKRWFFIAQSGSVFGTCLKLSRDLIQNFFTAIAMILLVAFVFMDKATIDSAFTVEISALNVLEVLFQLRGTIIVIAFAISVFAVAINSSYAFRNLKEEAEQENSRQVERARNTIELVEEVLHRHDLINTRDK